MYKFYFNCSWELAFVLHFLCIFRINGTTSRSPVYTLRALLVSLSPQNLPTLWDYQNDMCGDSSVGFLCSSSFSFYVFVLVFYLFPAVLHNDSLCTTTATDPTSLRHYFFTPEMTKTQPIRNSYNSSCGDVAFSIVITTRSCCVRAWSCCCS